MVCARLRCKLMVQGCWHTRRGCNSSVPMGSCLHTCFGMTLRTRSTNSIYQRIVLTVHQHIYCRDEDLVTGAVYLCESLQTWLFLTLVSLHEARANRNVVTWCTQLDACEMLCASKTSPQAFGILTASVSCRVDRRHWSLPAVLVVGMKGSSVQESHFLGHATHERLKCHK